MTIMARIKKTSNMMIPALRSLLAANRRCIVFNTLVLLVIHESAVPSLFCVRTICSRWVLRSASVLMPICSVSKATRLASSKRRELFCNRSVPCNSLPLWSMLVDSKSTIVELFLPPSSWSLSDAFADVAFRFCFFNNFNQLFFFQNKCFINSVYQVLL